MIGLTIGGYFVLVHLYFNDLAISCWLKALALLFMPAISCCLDEIAS